ncbi:MAG TPA: carboxypeptidase regulatory-like domain-containing protein [Isosphaeraceae bacterium]|nr:carboxypeptidase regulatory-like domain-containing protein [Isosphaeraceae bacterium]
MTPLLPSALRVSILTLGLWFLVSGCGGNPETVDEGVVVPSGTPSKSGPSEPEPTPAASAEAKGWGTLRGRVTFAGDPPKPRILVGKGEQDVKDAAICSQEEILDQSLVVDPETRGVRWALVYIPKPSAVNPEAESSALAEPVEFDQKGCVFSPHVLAVMKGNRVLVKSSDPVGHNVHTLLRNTSVNQVVSQAGALPVDITRADNRPGQVVCDIHTWMTAWWLTLDTPYFAVTDEKGEYEIRNVPAGSQKVVFWCEASGFLTPSNGSPVSLSADEPTVKDVVIEPTDLKSRK